MLVIRDEQIAARLTRIAEREKRPIEDVLKSLLERYPEELLKGDEADDAIQRYRAKLYAKARLYWQQKGDSARLALTDMELDEQFWLFDANGIPRLKSEQNEVEIPPGSGVRHAEAAETIGIHSEQVDIAQHADEILNDEFADYLLKRIQGKDDAH